MYNAQQCILSTRTFPERPRLFRSVLNYVFSPPARSALKGWRVLIGFSNFELLSSIISQRGVVKSNY